MTKRNYHHGNLKTVLLESAMDLLGEYSIDEISMKQLSDLAGVSHNAPYRHFKNKKALETSLAQRGFDMLTERLSKAAREGDSSSIIDQFIEMGKAYVRFGLDFPDLYRLMYGNTDLSPQNYPDLAQSIQRTRHQLLQMITRCQESNLIKKGKRGHQAMTVWSMSHGLTMLLIDNQLHTGELEEMIDVSTRTLLEGLKR